MIAVRDPRHWLRTLVAAALIWLIGTLIYTSAGLGFDMTNEPLFLAIDLIFLGVIVAAAFIVERRGR